MLGRGVLGGRRGSGATLTGLALGAVMAFATAGCASSSPDSSGALTPAPSREAVVTAVVPVTTIPVATIPVTTIPVTTIPAVLDLELIGT